MSSVEEIRILFVFTINIKTEGEVYNMDELLAVLTNERPAFEPGSQSEAS